MHFVTLFQKPTQSSSISLRKNSQNLSQDVVWLSVYGSAFLFPEPVRDFQQMMQPRQHCLESGKIRHAPLPVGVAAGAGGIDPGIRIQ